MPLIPVKLIRIILFFTLTIISSEAIGQSKTDSLKRNLNVKNQSTYLPTLLELCWEYRYKNPDSARIYGYQALKISIQKKDKNIEVEALHNLAITYEAQGDYKKSLKYNLEALQIRKQLKNELKEANTLNNIGIAYDELGSFTLALKFYNAAYQIFKRHNDLDKIAMVDLNFGILFKAHQDYPQVIKYYHEAKAIYEKLNKPIEIAFAEANLGSVYYYTKQYDSCIYYSLKAQKTFEKNQILQFLPLTYTNAGIGYSALGNTEKALVFLNTAVKLNTKYNNRKELSFTHIHLAKLMLKLKKLNEARANATKAITVAENIGASKQVMDAKEILATIANQQGNYDEAYQLYLASTKIKDSLFQKDKTALISDYQVRYETEKKEDKIKSLNQQSIIQKLQLKQRNLFLIISCTLLALVAIVSYLLYSKKQLKNKALLQNEINKQQDLAARAVLDAEERERRRIAGDLHDGVGQMLSAALMNMNSLFKKLTLTTDEDIQAQKTLALVNESYDEMRTISHQMMPNALIKSGLASAVKEFLNKIDQDIIKINLETIGLQHRINEQTETVLYRIIQETVNNVIKHSGANKLDIVIIKDEEGVSATIEDNGKGFDKTKIKKDGIGITNIYSRVAFLKGTVDIDSSTGKGTLVAIHIPD